jgi:transposase-like protein
MVLIPVLCPHCHSDHVIKGGKTTAGQQRFKCQNTACPCYSFQLDLLYKGRCPPQKLSSHDFCQPSLSRIELNGSLPRLWRDSR